MTKLLSKRNYIDLLPFSPYFGCFPVLKLVLFSLLLSLSIFVTIIVLNDWRKTPKFTTNESWFHFSTMLQANPHTFFPTYTCQPFFPPFTGADCRQQKMKEKKLEKFANENFKFTILKPLKIFLCIVSDVKQYVLKKHSQKICYKKQRKI